MTWQKKYRWKLTWPGERHEDWSAYDGKICIGRIMLDKTTHSKSGSYMWTGNAAQHEGFPQRIMPHQGWEQEHWQAAKAVEDWYDRMRERNGLPQRERNAHPRHKPSDE